MNRHVLSRFAKAALGGLLALGVFGTLPAAAAAQSIPAGFDCTKAERPVDRFICAYAVLRWQDLALSRAYAAAKAAAVGPARDDLIQQQRDWVRERDRRCIADRSFKELSSASSPPAKRAYDCLDMVYLDRRRVLQDLAAPPLLPSTIAPLALAPLLAARPDIQVESDLRIAGIQVSPDGTLLAILLPSQEIDLPDQVWLYRVADGTLVEATPRPDQQQPHPDDAPMAIQALAWQGGTLYAHVTLWGPDGSGNPERNASAVYAATMAGRQKLETVPHAIQALLDRAAEPEAIDPDEVTAGDQDAISVLRGNHDFLVWTVDLGRGTIELRTRKRPPPGAPVYRAAWGSWELGSFLFDAHRSQIAYAADTGIILLDLATHGDRRIAGTARGDQPYARSADQSLLVWSTRNACGDESLTAQNDSAPQRFCLAHLTTPKARP
ncbi:lysozyme inhibitor LprI family protein [Castellaniella hirudinis]|uniref:Lysozyme inhibitor LprI family protein n=1 Tax=Castellaniella hirudinis TaxID=1144617 RepID=A0ABV8S2D1_9BURK